MEKQELFTTHKINESHNTWNATDDRFSIEIYRIMHDGNLPPKDDLSTIWVHDFLMKIDDVVWFSENIRGRSDSSSLLQTAKRFCYMQADEIIKEINQN